MCEAGHEGRDGSLWERRLLGRKKQKPEPQFPRLVLRTHAVAVLHIPGQGPGNGDRVP